MGESLKGKILNLRKVAFLPLWEFTLKYVCIVFKIRTRTREVYVRVQCAIIICERYTSIKESLNLRA